MGARGDKRGQKAKLMVQMDIAGMRRKNRAGIGLAHRVRHRAVQFGMGIFPQLCRRAIQIMRRGHAQYGMGGGGLGPDLGDLFGGKTRRAASGDNGDVNLGPGIGQPCHGAADTQHLVIGMGCNHQHRAVILQPISHGRPPAWHGGSAARGRSSRSDQGIGHRRT